MISEDELERHCHTRTMQRARAIASSDRNILTKQARYEGSEAILSAFVASSHGWNDRYRTSTTIDEDEDLIIDYSCSCPAFFEYDGMCKHCAALVLSYNDAPERFLGYRAHRTHTTSAGLSDLLQRGKLAAADKAHGTIDIETALTYGYGNWSARFKLVGPHGSYVMKSISEFVARMRTGERFSYGKKLSFAHVPAVLNDHARAVTHFLERAVSLRGQTSSVLSGRFGSHPEVGRSLDLSAFELVELLDILAGHSFTVEATDRSMRSVTTAHVVENNPHLEVTLQKTSGGYDIQGPDDAKAAAEGGRLYVWHDDIFYRCSADYARTADFLCALFDNGGHLFVSEEDLPLFCSTLLPLIEEPLVANVPPEIDAYRPVPCQLEFYFDKDNRTVTCSAQSVYGERRFHLFEEGGTPAGSTKTGEHATTRPAPLRDEAAEAQARSLVERYFDTGSKPPAIPLADDAAVGDLLFGGLAAFQELGTAFTTPAFDRLLFDGSPHVTVGLSLVGNLINLEVSADELPASEVAALLSSYRLRKRFHRLKSGVFFDLAGLDLAHLDQLADDFGISARKLASGTAELPAYRAFYLDEQLPEARREESFSRYLESLRTKGERVHPLPPDFAGTLRPYQEEGFRWMNSLADRDFGGILADEMGLGKSAQLIAFLLARRDEARAVGPSLIVCPASLVYNWLAEFERFAPMLDVRAAVGTKAERMRIRAEAFAGNAQACDVLVTSYDLLRIDATDYAGRAFYTCALDEAQYVKNHATKTARAAKRVEARHHFALTGTPMENRLSELWSIFDFLMPGLLGSYLRFRERFELPVMGGDEDAAQRLRALVNPFMLRRLKKDVLDDLPDKLESVVHVRLEGEQRKLYAAHEQRLRDRLAEQKKERRKKGSRRPANPEKRVEVLAELMKLRQLCCDPRLIYENAAEGAKLAALVELVESARDAGEKTLVFSQFTSFLALIAEKLEAHGIPYYTITGATPKKRRLELVNAFNADDTPAFLVSLKAGGTGLNLTGASSVIHADPWWNAAAQNQATDRAHRIGQTRVVGVCKVVAEDTIEERILRLQEAKSELADRVVGAEGVSLSSLSEDELLELLEG